jgi:demethylmenaquinone methyltransferase/2-methoxy-6-polyprenyl-1,4-benzoquinol methylase
MARNRLPSPVMSDNLADFGFTTVPAAEKAGLVRGVFDRVARRYDVMNDLMSLGTHRVWKRIFVNALNPRPGERILDLAGGTGDIAGAVAARGARVILSDINEAMLRTGRDRLLERGSVLPLLAADAEALPFAARQFDAVTIAFGLRNCTNKDAVLREAHRVLRPGGRFFCLEFSQITVAALEPLYDAWSFRALPWLGARVAGDAGSYQYLAESIRTFPDQERLRQMLADAGFARAAFRNLSGGIVAIHSGWKLA